ncbi:MAG TPA: sigma-70 family RNA polymerase sigma factor [Bryobacteraceae bacterium]|nr:sigma-70 family RNA polymerase sigma factor [Bryobacteraceae bacterium]
MPVLEQPSDVLRQFCYADLNAFESLFRRHQSDVYGWIVRIIRDPAAAEDLTVQTFWRIYRIHARFDPSRSFEPWARRIATNAALDHLKTMRLRWISLKISHRHQCPTPAFPTSFAGKRRTHSGAFRRPCKSRPRWP